MRNKILILICFLFAFGMADAKPSKAERKQSPKQKNEILKQIDKAQQYALKMDFDKALQIYSKVLAKDPKSLPALIGRAELFVLLDKYYEAIGDYNRFIDIDSTNPYAYYRRALAKCKTDSIGYALEDYEKSLALDSTNADILYDWALYNLSYDNLLQAINDFKTVLKINPEKTDANKYIALAYYRWEQFDNALEYYNKALQSDPNNPSLYLNRGNSLLKLNKTEDAINDYSKAFSLDSLLEDAIMNRAFAHYQLGDEAAAEADKALLEHIKAQNILKHDDRVDITKCKVFADSTNQLKIYLPAEFHQTNFSDSEVISMGVTREDIQDLNQGFIVGVIVEKILDPKKTIQLSTPTELLGYLKACAASTVENAYNSHIELEKQKPLSKYGQGAFFQYIKHQIKYSVNEEELTQYMVGFFKNNTIVIHRYIFPSKLAGKYEAMVMNAIERFEF